MVTGTGQKEREKKTDKERQTVSCHFLCFIGSMKGANRAGRRYLATGNAVYHTECSIWLLGMDGSEAGLGDFNGVCVN